MKTLVCVFFVAVGAFAASITNSSNSAESSVETEDIDNATIVGLLDDATVQRCINDPEALTRARNSGPLLLRCMRGSNHHIHEFVNQLGNHTIDTVLAAEFCRNILQSMQNCTQELEDSLRPCLNESDMTAVLLYNKLPRTLLTKVCSENGRYLAESDILQDETCLGNQMGNLDTCTDPLLGLLQEARRQDRTMLTLPRFLQSQNGCRLFREGAHCVRQAFSTCEPNGLSIQILGAINATENLLSFCVNEPSARNP